MKSFTLNVSKNLTTKQLVASAENFTHDNLNISDKWRYKERRDTYMFLPKVKCTNADLFYEEPLTNVGLYPVIIPASSPDVPVGNKIIEIFLEALHKFDFLSNTGDLDPFESSYDNSLSIELPNVDFRNCFDYNEGKINFKKLRIYIDFYADLVKKVGLFLAEKGVDDAIELDKYYRESVEKVLRWATKFKEYEGFDFSGYFEEVNKDSTILTSMNCTGRELRFFKQEDIVENDGVKRILRKDAEPIAVIPPSNVILESSILIEEKSKLNGISLYKATAIEVDPIPDDADIIIVDEGYASDAIRSKLDGVERLYIPSIPVYFSQDDSKIAGYFGLERVVYI